MTQKALVFQLLIAEVEKQRELLLSSINEVQASANEETKSSAGDKYETGRAMAQLEVDKLKVQLHQTNQWLQTLTALPTEVQSEKVVLGSLVKTDQGNFAVCIPWKQLHTGAETWQPVSPQAPLALAMMGKKKGDIVLFQQRTFHIFSLE